MKRIVAGLLACVLLLTVMANTAFAAVRLPYTYGPVQIVLGDKNVTDEMAFREWAYEKLFEYSNEYLERETPSFELYDEYYKLASYKSWFDDVFGKETNVFGDVIRSIEYTSETMTEEQMDEMYLKVMLDTLTEMKQVNPNFVSEYLAKSDEERKIYTLGVDGKWQENDMLAAADEKAEADFANEMTVLIADSLDLAITTAVSYNMPSKGDIINSITSVVTDAMKEIAKTTTDNFKTKAENQVKKYLAEQMVNTLMDVKAADIACLKEVYLSGKYADDERMVKTAQKIIDYYQSDAMKQALLNKGKEVADEQITEALNSIGLELQAELETLDIVIISAMDIVRLALMETLEQILSNINDGTLTRNGVVHKDDQKKPLTQVEQGWNGFIMSFLETMVNTICDKIEENWIETGTFDVAAGFKYDEEDFGKLLKEVNFFRIITDNATLKMARDNMNKAGDLEARNKLSAAEQAKEIEAGLLGRLVYVLVYYTMLELPENMIDDLIEQNTQTDYTENMMKSLGDNLMPLLKDMFLVAGDYLLEQEKNEQYAAIEEEKKQKLNEIKKARENKQIRKNASENMMTEVRHSANSKLSKLKEELKEKSKAIEIVANVAGTAWDVGGDIVDMNYAALDYLNGEDGMSLLAQEVVTAKELSQPLTWDILRSGWYNAKDPEKMSVSEVWSLVSKMKQSIAYDVSGSNAYYNVDLQGSDQRKNTDFMKLLNGKGIFRYNIFKFQAGNITYDYENVYGNRGLVTLDQALNIRNAIIDWKDYLNEGWKDEWLLLPGIAD